MICPHCGKNMVSAHYWEQASAIERAEWLEDDWVPQGRGTLCRSAWNKQRREQRANARVLVPLAPHSPIKDEGQGIQAESYQRRQERAAARGRLA